MILDKYQKQKIQKALDSLRLSKALVSDAYKEVSSHFICCENSLKSLIKNIDNEIDSLKNHLSEGINKNKMRIVSH